MNLVQKGQVVSSSTEQKLVKKGEDKSDNKGSGNKSSNKSSDNSKSKNRDNKVSRRKELVICVIRSVHMIWFFTFIQTKSNPLPLPASYPLSSCIYRVAVSRPLTRVPNHRAAQALAMAEVSVEDPRTTARIMIHPHSLKSPSRLASHLVNQGMASLLARVHPSPRAVVLAVTVNVKSIAVKRHVKPISVPVVSVVI